MSLIIIIHTVLVENFVCTPDTVGIGGKGSQRRKNSWSLCGYLPLALPDSHSLLSPMLSHLFPKNIDLHELCQWVSLTSGFWLALTCEEHQQDTEEWECGQVIYSPGSIA